jgi:hypothetical protein
MLRNAMIALIAMASLTFLPSNAASARGGGMYGGGMHMGGGGMHFSGGHFGAGHFGGGHFSGGHFGGFHHHFGGIGFYPFPVYDYYPYEESYPYYGGDCYLVRQRVHTRHGWRLRTVQVCE